MEDGDHYIKLPNLKKSMDNRKLLVSLIIILCNDSEIEIKDGEVCQICGNELEECDEVTGTGIFGYYHWTCIVYGD